MLATGFHHKTLTKVLERAKVAPAWSGATSAWLLKWPAELKAHSPIEIDTSLHNNQKFNSDRV
jgi:hypothetical protein